ncbi:MAG: NAD(P)-dependent oxidoreductase [Bacteroidia bacterium]|nr:NAD(P)-dependent oxidoreductase [Bacteroidia bacterium]MDW8416380.1 NAD(P)-dependent oxidoreductase [Bacteroidia bacterium]
MRVLITGARGLVGYHVAEAFANVGSYIHLTSRGKSPFPDFPYTPVDLTDREAVAMLIAEARPDVVIHSAAMTMVDACQEQPAQCWMQNVTATRYLLEVLTERFPKAHFVFVSTDFVYDGFPAERRPYIEGDYEAPLSVYGASKLAAEAWVRTYPGPWAIARTALVYGYTPTLQRDNILLRVLARLRAGKDIQLFVDQIRTPTWAQDLAEGLKLLAEKRAQGIFHLAGSDIETPYGFGQKVARIWGLPEEMIQPITEKDFRSPAPRPLYSPLSIEKAQALGYQPHSIDQALRILREAL